jgi:hypothetical protein
VKSILVLFALAFGGPVLIDAILFDPNAATIRAAAAWTLMLLGTAGVGLVLRMERKPAPGRYAGSWRATTGMWTK